MERETLSNNTEYQERLREARIKGAPRDHSNMMMQEQIDFESRRKVCMTMHTLLESVVYFLH